MVAAGFGTLRGSLASIVSSKDAEAKKCNDLEAAVVALQQRCAAADAENESLRRHGQDTQAKASESLHELRRLHEKRDQGPSRKLPPPPPLPPPCLLQVELRPILCGLSAHDQTKESHVTMTAILRKKKCSPRRLPAARRPPARRPPAARPPPARRPPAAHPLFAAALCTLASRVCPRRTRTSRHPVSCREESTALAGKLAQAQQKQKQDAQELGRSRIQAS